MSLRPVLFILGLLIGVIALAMLAPLATALIADDGQWPAFAGGVLTTAFIALGLVLPSAERRIVISRHDAFLLTSLVWTVLPLIGSLPLHWSDIHLSVTDAVFESVSGITTTGSTVLAGLDRMPASILIWRSVLQWVGGIGIIAMGIAILPFLKVGGMQIFRTESSDRSDKAVPRVGQFANWLIGIYAGLTAACALAYWMAGMTGFEAINHAMTTISTGGYSTSDLSMGHFGQPAIHWIGTVFMLLGALPFVLYIHLLSGRGWRLIEDLQVRALASFLIGISLGLSIWLALRFDIEWSEAIRLTAFNVTSVVTTTGYATSDYSGWGAFAVIIFYFLTYVGGSSGSTSGGFKIYRFLILFQFLKASMLRLTMPHAVVHPTYGGRPIDHEILYSVAMFVALFMGTVFVTSVALAACGLDIVTSFSGAATAVANVGPGMGSIIGPAGNFAPLPDAAKWILCAAMILGRLEIVTMAVIVLPRFWRW